MVAGPVAAVNDDFDEMTPPGPAFWSKVDRGDCWEWQGEIGKGGYGIWYPGRPRYGTRYVHRIVWLALISVIPDGYEVDHECWVRHCVRPSHMQLLTLAENRRSGRRNWLFTRDALGRFAGSG
jgi:hypothetical protein